MKTATLLLVACLCAFTANASFNFVSIGDWGCMPMGGYYAQDELIVARAFQQAATELNARFVLNTGDNFYHCGVHNKTDAVWDTTFEDVFTSESTMVPWYSCLGNHDYGYPGSASAQIAYKSPKNDRWKLPARYYYKRLVFSGEVSISLVVLDSSPCQAAYRSSDDTHWDPKCTPQYNAQYCPGCTFHENVVAQSCTDQLTWLNGILSNIPKDDWKIVMTHAPAYNLDVEDLLAPLQAHGFHLYLNGHIHLLEQYTMDGKGVFITTGAGCWVRVPGTIETGDEPPKLSRKKAQGPVLSKHNYQSVWQQTVAGYTTHSFSSDFSTLTTSFYNYDGQLLHAAVSHKHDKK